MPFKNSRKRLPWVGWGLLCFLPVALFGTAPVVPFSEGKDLLIHNQTSQAVAYFRQAVERFPKNKEAYVCLSVALEQQNDYIEAVGVLNLALVRLGQDADLYYNLGNCYFALGNWLQAISQYDFAVNRNADYANAYLNRGNAKVKLMHYHDAVDDYVVFLQLAPEDPQREAVQRMIDLLKGRPDGIYRGGFGGYGEGGAGYPGGSAAAGGAGGGYPGYGGGKSLNLQELLDGIVDLNKKTNDLKENPEGSVEDNYNIEFDIE